MKKFILLTSKRWHQNLFKELSFRKEEVWKLISNVDDFYIESLLEFNPEKIFIPHWSHIIPQDIWSKFDCVVFHMTDLPYGRGGSPLQNLIIKGYSETKISALKVGAGIDSGDIYLKKTLSLNGTAREIFNRASPIIIKMIEEIIESDISPIPQKGEPTHFKRRKPAESSIANLSQLNEVYDYIRMLDCEGYPNAYFETENLRIEFRNASFSCNEILANVRITKK